MTAFRFFRRSNTKKVPWWDAVGHTLYSGDLIGTVKREAAVQHPGPYELYVEMWSVNHKCWCRPVLDKRGRVEVLDRGQRMMRHVQRPNTAAMSNRTDAQVLADMGTDAHKWAQEFARRHGGDEGLLLGWFANAIEAGRDAANSRHRQLKEHTP